MDTSMELPTDFTEARDKRRVWTEYVRPANLFRGEARVETSTINKTEVTRLSVLPSGCKTVPHSFTVSSEPAWSAVNDNTLPFGFEWQQSLSGRFDFYFKLQQSDKCLALGERFNALNLRGKKHTLITTDNPHHTESMDSMYKSIPFLIIGSGKEFCGVFIDSPAPTRFDLDSEMTQEGHIEVLTRRGFRVYFIGKGTLPEIVEAFTTLTGRGKLPPLWSLGHQQCRWSYPDEPTVRELAKEFRDRKIPCDTLVLDIDYMDEYRVFTTSEQRFPRFNQMIKDLRDKHFRVVTIIDPGVKEDGNYDVFQEGVKENLFCKTTGDKLFVQKVWPGESVFPDFLQEKTRQWWASKHKTLTDSGVSGIWNDMNEPAFFGLWDVLSKDAEEMPTDDDALCLHQTPEGPAQHLEVRNLYGFLMCRSTYEALMNLRSDERPFILTRSANAGIQRYAAVWLGDNKSWYQHLQKSIPMLLNVGLSGIPFGGVDIGGFWHDAPPELVIRWYELGIFYPFFRNHCALNFRGQEPFAYAPNVESIARKLIETRYRLLPYIRNLFWENLRTGAPLMRPLMWHYPTDPAAADIDDQFMFGSDILVAPILEGGHQFRSVYLPEGNWYQWDTNKKLEGGRSHMIHMPMGTVPAFVREGAILPLTEVMQHTDEYTAKDITFVVYGDNATGRYFEDDGISFGYESGKYTELQLSCTKGEFKSMVIHRGFESQQKLNWQLAGQPKSAPVGTTMQ